jgi:uncharacterized Zn-finger protein
MKKIKTKVKSINLVNLKANRKLNIKQRSVEHRCPYCLSRLMPHLNTFKCSAEKVFMLTDDFKLFANLEDDEQDEFLSELEDPNTFLDLFEKWESNELDCNYNNKFHNPIDNKFSILDPLAVLKVEESLGRELTEEEKANQSPIWTDGVNYFDEYDKGLILFKLPLIAFPEDI